MDTLEAKNPKIRGEIFNAGPNEPISVRKILEKIFKLANNQKDLEIIIKLMQDKKTSGEIDFQSMDYEKVNKFFGWKPSVGIDEGMNITLEWFKKYLN